VKELPFSEGDGMGYPFLLSSQEDDSNAEGTGRVMVMCSKTEEDRAEWMDAIQNIVSHRETHLKAMQPHKSAEQLAAKSP